MIDQSKESNHFRRRSPYGRGRSIEYRRKNNKITRRNSASSAGFDGRLFKKSHKIPSFQPSLRSTIHPAQSTIRRYNLIFLAISAYILREAVLNQTKLA
jgi:hypothetical protein